MRHMAGRAANRTIAIIRQAINCALVLGICAGPAWAQSAAEKEAASLRASSCSTCHGADGNSSDAKTPRLNGQNRDYLYRRLLSFRYPIREAPHAIHTMGIAGATLSDSAMRALAGFYAGQKPFGPRAGVNTIGASLYRDGAKDIPACQTCHGATGEGAGTAPRLAGQHREYLQAQLVAFTMAARIADPMNHHVWVMKDEQAQAVAAYLGH